MHITNRAISELKPYPQNAKQHPEKQIRGIAESIKRFGFTQPLVIDAAGVVVIGHGRLLAAKHLKLQEVPVVTLGELNEAEIKALRILDNKLNESPWDNALLLAELKTIDLDLAPFELNFESNGLKPEVKEDDFVPPPAEEIKTTIEKGDLIQLGVHFIYCADSRSVDNYSHLMRSQRAALVVTDPPYGMGQNWNGLQKLRGNEQVKNDEAGSYADFLKDFLQAVTTAPALKASCCFYLWFASAQTVTARGVVEAMGFKVHCIIIWVKEHFNVGRADYHSQYEPCLYFSIGPDRYWCGKRDQSDIWNAARLEQERVHPTQKPLSLIGKAIENSSQVGEIVLDPFLGSGTTLIAAEQLNRICYGLEIEPKYCQVMIDRYRAHCIKTNKQFRGFINNRPIS